MTLDSIIEKYGMHELDIDFCKRYGDKVIIFAYCHRHNVKGVFMVNHYLKIQGNIIPIKIDVEDVNDISIHLAFIEKNIDGIYEISGCGGSIQFSVEGDLLVEELTEEDYQKQLA